MMHHFMKQHLHDFANINVIKDLQNIYVMRLMRWHAFTINQTSLDSLQLWFLRLQPFHLIFR